MTRPTDKQQQEEQPYNTADTERGGKIAEGQGNGKEGGGETKSINIAEARLPQLSRYMQQTITLSKEECRSYMEWNN